MRDRAHRHRSSLSSSRQGQVRLGRDAILWQTHVRPERKDHRDRSATVRPHRPSELADHLRRRRLLQHHPGALRARARDAARARHQPHRHRRRLRRFGAPPGALDEAAPPRLLPRHQDRRAHLRRRQAIDRALAPAARGRAASTCSSSTTWSTRTEWRTALGPRGALEAAIEARDQGLVRFLGVTGHGWDVARRHRESLERHPFDSVLLPYNFPMMSHPEYARDFESLLEICAERGVAVQTIKSVARRRWKERTRTALQLVRAAARRAVGARRGPLRAAAARGSSSTPRATPRCCRSCSTRRETAWCRGPTPTWRRSRA